MFWMMNGMGPHGCRRMHHRGYHPMGGLPLFPGVMLGGLVGLLALFAVLNVAGLVAGTVFTGLAAVFSFVLRTIDYVFSGIRLHVSLPIGIVIGLALYFSLRRRNARSGAEEV